ncbi:unnamed protein product [Peronospora belbahrii]|uniref:Sodium/calcium exchanger membrane region domain-containing protein n=1 Tax=Peronospora belbahrii TaxID=622444 RepID=A0AAU9L6Z9_9STRA|nr:unnamed protein product [Peronospora belbahrii]
MAMGYIFVSLAIICDDYFVSALEKISHQLGLPSNVTGATFMAAGSSAPELFVSLADNVFQKPAESLGVGTIVGSGIFNILIIISLSGLLAGQVLKLDWRPLLRDLIWYTWAMSVLVFAVWDGNVDIFDSVIMVCSYASYIGYMAINERVIDSCCKRPEMDEEQGKEREKLALTSGVKVIVTNGDVQKSMDKEGHLGSQHDFVNEQDKNLQQSKDGMFEAQEDLVSTNQPVNVEARIGEEPLAKYFDQVLVPPAGILPKLWFVFTWPIVALARITIPDCRDPVFSGPLGFSATFLASIVWIGVLSHYTVIFGTMFGCAAGIPPALMGLTIIAVGTSIPDALSSILVARSGHGDMAVSNAFGSNVFDILFGLGLPFLLSNLVYNESVIVSGDDVDLALGILFAVLLFVVLVLVLSHWRLYPLACVFLLILYAIYITFSYLHGLET